MKPKTSAQIRRVISQKCAAAGVPCSGIFELTPRCNLQCKMCYVRMTPEQMAPIGRERTAEEWLAFAREAVDAGMLFLLLTGGEPTLRSDFGEIYEGLSQMGLSISINTNGTHFTPELKALFHRLPPAQINITLYGTCPEEYEELCGWGGAYDSMLDTLNWLKAEGILTHLNCTMIPGNLNKWESFEAFAKDIDLELRMTTYCFPPVRRTGCSDFTRLSPEDAGEMAVRDLFYREGPDAVKKRLDSLAVPDADLPPESPADTVSGSPAHNANSELGGTESGDPIPCLAGKSQFWVNWNGQMVPCGMLESPAVYPFDSGFLPAWEALKEETAAIRLCPDCVKCTMRDSCMNCAAVIYTETGTFHKKPEYSCRMNQAYREALKKYGK